MSTRTEGALLAALLVSALAACGDESGSGGATSGKSGATTDTAATGPACGPLEEAFADPDCGACAETSCCDELAACTALPCATLDPCLTASCSTECSIVTQGICGTDFTTADAACDACVDPTCCADVTACTANAACAACLADASGPGCGMNALLTALEACFAGSCSNVCDG